MATLEHVPTQPRPEQDAQESASNGALNRLLVRPYAVNWELIFYIVIFILAVVTRFVNLGDRVMSHDESLHTYYSYQLYERGNFQHTPLMHGPVLFHATALSYFLFGDSDFSARLYPAILGVIMVMMPWLLFRRWLGKFGAMAASVFILISPMLLYHHRYIREDTPAIFFTMLMVYAMFVYIDGTEARRRQPRWLILLSAAMLLNLASKETAFMYILIFAVFVGLFLLLQMLQGWRSRVHSPAVGWAVAGVVAVPVLGIAGILVAAALNIEASLPTTLTLVQTEVLGQPILLEISGDLLSLLAMVVIGVVTALALGTLAIIAIWAVWSRLLGRPLLYAVDALATRARSLFKLTLAGVLLGAVAALIMTNVFAIIQPENIERASQIWANYEAEAATAPAGVVIPAPLEPHPEVYTTRLILWTGAMIVLLAMIVVGTALVKFRHMPRLPWMDIVLVTLLAALTFAVMFIMEERSRAVPNVSSEVRAASVFDNRWINGPWVIGILAVAGILYLRYRTTFWQEMRRYPAFDVVIVIGSLILPWSAAFPIFQAGYPLDGSYTDIRVINASITALIPFFAISIAAGLAWHPRVWLACTATFYAIFAFFFTTVFTNPTGVATGLVGSLGYWLAQQGVRRGSQPQYYYMLIQIPVYEYLTLIGASLAGILGTASLWGFRARRIAAQEAQRQAESVIAEAERVELIEVEEVGVPAQTQIGISRAAVSLDQAARHVPVDESDTDGADGVDVDIDLDQTFQQTTSQAPGDDNFPADPEGYPEYDADIVPDAYEAPWPGGRKHKGTLLRPVDSPAAAWAHAIPEDERLVRPLFVVFTGFWAVMILYALTLAGEKMPWLTTQITLPMALLSGWYVGKVLEGIDWQSFWQRRWTLILLVPMFIVGLVNVIGPFVVGRPPFGGLSREEQMRTFTWIGALILTAIVGYAIHLVSRRPRLEPETTADDHQAEHADTSAISRLRAALAAIRARWARAWDFGQVGRTVMLGVFVLLGVLTARTAWAAAYINYDMATEYLVYAHGAPGNRVVMDYLAELSRRMTDGMNIRVAYDNQFSWPGSWYMRQFPRAAFLGDTTGATGLDEYFAIVVGDANSRRIEPQLGDRFYRFDMIRLWWPMQDYFGLTLQRVDNALGDAEMRQGLWDIWWSRDYQTYGRAKARMTGTSPEEFNIDRWPVSDRMVFYVRRDVAAQIWDFGVGAARVSGLPEDPFSTLRCDTCAAETAFTATGVGLNNPRGVALGPDGNIYLADTQNSRVVVLNAEGEVVRQFGSISLVSEANPVPPLGTLREPWGIAVAHDGRVYVADTWNHRVHVFTAEGEPITAWGMFERVDPSFPEGGSAVGFYGPRDIAIDDQGRVYVADTGNKRIRVYDDEGNHLYDFGREGQQPGQMYEPVGLAINNATREIFVANTWNKRIDVYTLEGQLLRSWSLQAWYGTTSTTDSGSRPYLTLDSTGTYLFVTDPDSARVLVFDTNGAPRLAFGRLGVAPYTLSQFGVLGGLATDAEGRLILVDSAGGRVLRFGRNALPGLTPPLDTVSSPSVTEDAESPFEPDADEMDMVEEPDEPTDIAPTPTARDF